MKSLQKLFSPIRRLYDWTLSWAEHKAATWALFVLALAESSFFPIPPDVLGLALCAGKPKKSFWFAAVCSLGSIVGGMLGYLIGMLFWGGLGPYFFEYIPGFTPEIFDKVGKIYSENAIGFVFIAAFTPVPYKVITIAAGVFQIAFLPFLLATAVGRAMRFFLWGALVYFFGAGVKRVIDKYFELAVTLFSILLIGGFWVIKKVLH